MNLQESGNDAYCNFSDLCYTRLSFFEFRPIRGRVRLQGTLPDTPVVGLAFSCLMTAGGRDSLRSLSDQFQVSFWEEVYFYENETRRYSECCHHCPC